MSESHIFDTLEFSPRYTPQFSLQIIMQETLKKLVFPTF